MGKPLVIVESPAKARTITRFLGSGYRVEASLGHVRDLPSTASEIPPKVKEQEWARIGVDVDHDFKPLYIVPEKKRAQVAKLRAAAKEASELFLATDEDREGEAIAWHLLEVLKPNVPVRRMVFHEITQSAIRDALAHPRDLDQKLVDAQEARRILDRLYGYEVSPVLWRKVKPKLSAGRVQSVATRLVVDRERARMRFVTAQFWDLESTLLTRAEPKDRVFARLMELGGKRVATGKDFDPATGRLVDSGAAVQLGEEAARRLAAALSGRPFTVSDVTEKPFTQRPYPPFITSTLQQEAARKLRYSAQRTMRLAQSLYENGFITYMRTDSTNLSAQAVEAARQVVTELFGGEYLPPEPRVYARKVKGAQEAHEAIRPAGEVFRTPESLREELGEDELRLYDLIWKRTVASQMKDATGRRTTVHLAADAGPDGRAVFSATGKVISFAGFLRAYVEGTDDPEAELEDQERILPPLRTGDVLDPSSLEPKGHSTQPPARYTEASLIKELEDRGIGRPSTYATILQTIQDRGYVWKKGSALVPTFTAFAVVNLLEQHFGELVDYDFTARMEDDLDLVASGEREAVPWLRDFYFGADSRHDGAPLGPTGLKKRIGTGWEEIDPRVVCSIPLGTDEEGQQVVVRVGRYGPYVQVGETDRRANLPEDLPPDEVKVETVQPLLQRSEQGDRVLGEDPESGKPIYLRSGRFGPYFQLGEAEADKGSKKAAKPKMASLFPWMKPESATFEDALQALSFPKPLGKHPRTGEEIVAQDGRFGPYLKMGSETRSLRDHRHLVEVSLEEAAALLDQPKQGRRAAGPGRVLAEVGEHPVRGKLQVLAGRFGPYVTDGKVNASLAKGRDPTTLTVEEAVEALEAREQRLRERGEEPGAAGARPSRTRAKAEGAPAGKSGRARSGTKKAAAGKAEKSGAGKATRRPAGRGTASRGTSAAGGTTRRREPGSGARPAGR